VGKDRVLVTGGGGYIGSVLVPKLLNSGYDVTVLDLFYFGHKSLDDIKHDPGLSIVCGDTRDFALVSSVLMEGGFSAVVHLAAISNDPSSDLDPSLTRDVNLKATKHLMHSASQHQVPRFVFASSASVYGIKETPDVHEDLPLEPITLYAQTKAEGETMLNDLVDDNFCGVSVRAATVCGYSPRLRLDLTINILTYHALTRSKIGVFGGSQMRPNVHIEDLTDFYVLLLSAPSERINGNAFNVSTENASVLELAQMVRRYIDQDTEIEIVPTNDLRSYRLSSQKVAAELGFVPRRPLSQACSDLQDAFRSGLVPCPEDAVYRNIEYMKRKPMPPVTSSRSG
jgi:nucleoside-diphosphate-sugar epimerase